MKLYTIETTEDTDLEYMIFGFFTTYEYAEKAYNLLPPELQDQVKIVPGNLDLNTIILDDKIIDITKLAD